jgi:putative tryptophan/tyrosine transport system substrate-binding protein
LNQVVFVLLVRQFHFACCLHALRVALIGFCVLSSFATAQGLDREKIELRLLIADANDATKSVSDAFIAKYPAAAVEKTLVGTKFAANHLVVSIGANATRAACKNEAVSNLVVLFVTSLEFERIAQSCELRSITAIFAETSPRLQLDLIKEVFGNRAQVAVLTSDSTTKTHERLTAAARAAGISLSVEQITDLKNTVRTIARIPSIDVLLATADSGVYSSDNIREVLETTYRRGVPMIGFNPSSVKAGMLGATFANIDDVLNHFDDLQRTFVSTSRLPEPSHPRYWRTMFNDSVARSLSVEITASAKALGRLPSPRAN